LGQLGLRRDPASGDWDWTIAQLVTLAAESDSIVGALVTAILNLIMLGACLHALWLFLRTGKANPPVSFTGLPIPRAEAPVKYWASIRCVVLMVFVFGVWLLADLAILAA
jgi:hypothetical protein